MAAEYGQEAGLDALPVDPVVDLRGDFVEALAAGLDFEGLGGLLQGFLPYGMSVGRKDRCYPE